MPFPQPIQKRERSYDQKNITRIKSARPLNLDREKLMQENINLKTQLNKMQTEQINIKREITNLENELSQREKIIENMINESQIKSNTFAKASEMSLVINVKRQYKDLKKEYEKNIQLLEQAKQDIKNIRLNDLISENKNLSNQIEKFKNLYYSSEKQKKNIQKNVQDIHPMKEALSKQDDMLLSFQENCQKMEIEIFNLNDEIHKLQILKEKKEDMFNKLKKKLKIQKQLNEKLVMIRDNIQNTEVFCIMKSEYEIKIQNLRKDLAYYRDSNTKNEKLVKEAEKFKKNIKNEEQKQSESMTPTNITTRKIQASNPKPFSESENFTEDQANQKISLLQNLYNEEKNEVQKLKTIIEELEQKLQNSKMVEPKIILTKSYSANNIKKPIDVFDYDYFSDTDLKEFIYILVKNLEANKIDMSILESRVLNNETLELLKDKNNYKEFITQVGNNLIEILKSKNEKDQIEIHSFIKTFLYNNFIALEKQVPEEFKAKLLSLFTNINFYSLEQRQELNRIIAMKFCKNKTKFLELLNYFDEKENGYISFSIMNKIIEQLKIKFKPDVKEYFFYVLKSFPDEGNYLKDLKYDNILKILEDTPFDPNDIPVDIEGEEEKENNKQENEDEAIEITNEEYLSKVRDIISRICEILKKTKKKVDDYFLKIVSKSITDYRAIRLVKLVDALKEDFNIELSNIEIFCLFTKVKPNLASSKDADDIEEIIDYDKLKEEIENYLKNPPKKTEKEKKREDKKKSKAVSSKPINKEKLNYSDFLEHAPYENEKVEKKSYFPKILKDFMKKHCFSFERFVFPVHCMMKLANDGKRFNRYLDIEFFKHFLYQNGINIQSYDLIDFVQDNIKLYNNEKINIDYLKFIIEGDKDGLGLKELDFILFKQNMEKKPDRPEAAKIKQNKKKEVKKDENPFEESDSDSVKMIQKEINGEI
jgi:hypothetical protein